MLKLINNQGFKWINQNKIWFKGHMFKGNHLRSVETIYTELELVEEIDDFKKWLKSTNGCFSVVFEKNESIFAAVDIIRSLPLFYSIVNGQLVITDNPVQVFSSSSRFSMDACIELESAAYVTGNQTLFEGVLQLQAGEYLFYQNNQLITGYYTDINYNLISTSGIKDLKHQLTKILNHSFTKLLNSVKDKQVVVPLSGGYDSRLIVLMLKKMGHSNIITFTYGRKGSFELENSKKTAEILNLPWIFIDYNNALINNYLQDDIFKKYMHFAGKASSMFYMQDYFAVKYLHDNKLIEKNAVFVPGHSGDVIAGSHLRETLSYAKNRKPILNQIYSATFNQNNSLKSRKYFFGLIDSFIKNMKTYTFGYQAFEHWDYIERQAKFIVNSASVFDYFGYEYRLPYWDLELVDFFRTVPFEYKIYKKLYNSVLEDIYFRPNQLHFKKEIQASAFQVKKQQIKNRIKPLLPNKLKLKYLEKNDWMAYSLITKEMLDDLKNRGIKYKFKADVYNSIISKWYVESFKDC